MMDSDGGIVALEQDSGPTTPMLSPAMLMRFLDRYTAAMTAARMPSENNRNSSQAVFGHVAQRPLSRYELLPHKPQRVPM